MPLAMCACVYVGLGSSVHGAVVSIQYQRVPELFKWLGRQDLAPGQPTSCHLTHFPTGQPHTTHCLPCL